MKGLIDRQNKCCLFLILLVGPFIISLIIRLESINCISPIRLIPLTPWIFTVKFSRVCFLRTLTFSPCQFIDLKIVVTYRFVRISFQTNFSFNFLFLFFFISGISVIVKVCVEYLSIVRWWFALNENFRKVERYFLNIIYERLIRKILILQKRIIYSHRTARIRDITIAGKPVGCFLIKFVPSIWILPCS